MEIELTFETDISRLEEFRLKITDTIEKLIGKRDWNYDLMLALEEALVNIIEHGFKGDTNSPPIRLIMKKEENKLVMTLMDKAPPFDLTKRNGIKMEEHFQSYKNRGLGIFLIKNISDSLDYQFNPDDGNILIMEKKL